MENWIVIFYLADSEVFTENAETFVIKNTDYRDCCGWAKQEVLNSKSEYFGKKILVLSTGVLKQPEHQIAGLEVSYKPV